MKNVLGAIAGLLLVGYIAGADFTPPPAEPVIRDPYQAIWTPQVTITDCETWEISQRDAALEDLWPHVDYMTLDGIEYGTESVTLPRDGDRTFEFRFHSDGQQIYQVDLIVETRC